MMIPWIITTLTIAWAGSHQLDLSTVAVYEHRDRPFTQGIAVTERPECGGQVESKLEACLEEAKPERRAACYVRVLERCIILYESAGLYRNSFVQTIRNFNSGHHSARLQLPASIFAEGLTLLPDGDLLLGSWHERRAFRIKPGEDDSLTLTEEIMVIEPAEMWGLASDGNSTLWMTSGSSLLYEFDLAPLLNPNPPADAVGGGGRSKPALSPRKRVHIHDNGRRIRRINELEYHRSRGTLWGNVWMKDYIVEVDPVTGSVVGTLDLSQYAPLSASLGRRTPDDVWNGVGFIGYNWIIFTGKRFPYVFLGKLTLAAR